MIAVYIHHCHQSVWPLFFVAKPKISEHVLAVVGRCAMLAYLTVISRINSSFLRVLLSADLHREERKKEKAERKLVPFCAAVSAGLD